MEQLHQERWRQSDICCLYWSFVGIFIVRLLLDGITSSWLLHEDGIIALFRRAFASIFYFFQMWDRNFCVWILLQSLAFFLATKVILVYEGQWPWREGPFYSACTIPSQRKQCSLLYYMKKKIASDPSDADSDEGSGNAFSSHCFKQTLHNV